MGRSIDVLTDSSVESDPIHRKYLQSHENICGVLRRRGLSVRSVFARPGDDPATLFTQLPDRVLVCYSNGRLLCPSEGESDILGYLDAHGVPYTGSGTAALALQADKAAAKAQVARYGVPTAPCFVARPGSCTHADDVPLAYPLFAKPLYGGDSLGVDEDSIVCTFDELQRKLERLFVDHKQPALVEGYLPGQEFTVAVFQRDRGLSAYPIAVTPRRRASGVRIVGLKSMCEGNDEQVAMSKVDEPDLAARLKRIAIDAFTALGGRGHGRVDLRASVDGQLCFIEANLMPGIGLPSSYLSIARELNDGIGWQGVILEIAGIEATSTHAAGGRRI